MGEVSGQPGNFDDGRVVPVHRAAEDSATITVRFDAAMVSAQSEQ